MIELRWKIEQWTEYPEGFPVIKTEDPVFQYRVLFYPVLIASGDIVLKAYDSADWMDVPTEYVKEWGKND